MDRSIKAQLDQEDTRSVKIGGSVRKGSSLSPILFRHRVSNIAREILEGDFKTEEKSILTVQCADNLVLLAKEETVLQGIIDRLTEVVRFHGM
jgi:hypothetical protein